MCERKLWIRYLRLPLLWACLGGTAVYVLMSPAVRAQVKPNCIVGPPERESEVADIVVPFHEKVKSPTVSKTGAYDDINTHFLDMGVADGILEIIGGAGSALVLGAGTGCYVRYYQREGCAIDAYDGMTKAPELSGGVVKIADLAKPQQLDIRPWVVSLEVAEHIPREYESVFLDNVVRHAGCGVILSWAIPNQHGHHHVNEQSNEYVIIRLAELGFEYNENLSMQIRSKSHFHWFINTIMVFIRLNDGDYCEAIVPYVG